VTYTAAVTVPAPLVALMSADSTGADDKGDVITYTFSQKVCGQGVALVAMGSECSYRHIGIWIGQAPYWARERERNGR
jgi:hypothetical protein